MAPPILYSKSGNSIKNSNLRIKPQLAASLKRQRTFENEQNPSKKRRYMTTADLSARDDRLAREYEDKLAGQPISLTIGAVCFYC